MDLRNTFLAVLIGVAPSLLAAQQSVPSLLAAQQSAPLLPVAPGVEHARSAQPGQPAEMPAQPAAAPLPPAMAAPEPTMARMTLAELEQMAQGCNPTLVQAAARVEAARAQCVQVGLRPNPVVGYAGNEIGDEGRAGQQGGFVSQEIVTAGKLRLSRAVAAREIQQAQWAWDAQRRRVLSDVRRGYDEVLVAQRSIALTEQLVHVGLEGVKAAEALFQAKEVSRVDLLQAQIEGDSARILLEKARNRYLAAWRGLAAVVGVAGMQPRALEGNLEDGLTPVTWENALGRLLAENPLLASARVGVARAEAVLRREYAGAVPNLDTEIGVGFDTATRDTIAEVRLGLPLPVSNRNQGNIRRAQAEITVARHEVRRVELALQQRFAAAFEQYANSRTQVDKYVGQILPNAKTSLDLVTAGYRQGEFNYLTLLTAQRTYFQTNLAYLDSLRDLRSATVAMEGSLLIDSLQEARSTTGDAR